VNFIGVNQAIAVAIHEHLFGFTQTPITEDNALQKFEVHGVFVKGFEGVLQGFQILIFLLPPALLFPQEEKSLGSR